MTLRDYLGLLRRGWLIVLSTTLLAICIAAAATYLSAPTYSASSTVAVTSGGSGTNGPPRESGFVIGWARSYAALASTDVVIDKAASATGDEPAQLRASVTATARADTSFIDVVATASDPHLAAQRAQGVSDALVAHADVIEPPTASGEVRLATVSRAKVPATPTSPRTLNDIVIAAIIGLALGAGSLVVYQSLNTRIRTAADLPRAARAGTVISLPMQRSHSGRAVPGGDARLESFRHLRAHLQLTSPTSSCIAVTGVTSASDAQGIAHELARVFGEVGHAVLVVDADLRDRASGQDRDTPPNGEQGGIADVLVGTVSLDDVIGPGPWEGVSIMSAGLVKDSSAQLLSTNSMVEVLEQLRSRFAYVLLACPPVTERSESAVVAALSGSSLLVVESGTTRRAELLHALDLLDGVGMRPRTLAVDHVRGAEPIREARSGSGRHASMAVD